MFENHLYTFRGKVFKQKRDGPIGLRGTCVIARLVMSNWDRKFKMMMSRNRIYIQKYVRYMDGGRLFMAPIKRGWKWIQGELQYMKR